MASIMGGDFIEAYLMRRIYKEKIEEMEKNEIMEEKKKTNEDKRKNKKGFFGISKKKVAPTTSCSDTKTKP